LTRPLMGDPVVLYFCGLRVKRRLDPFPNLTPFLIKLEKLKLNGNFKRFIQSFDRNYRSESHVVYHDPCNSATLGAKRLWYF